MNRLSAKRAASLDAEAAFKLRLLERCGYKCEWCGAGNCELDHHELQRGSGVRHLQRACLYASVILCRPCHEILGRMGGQDAVLLGLAILRLRRPECYDLQRFISLVCPHAPRRFEQAEVDAWLRRISA